MNSSNPSVVGSARRFWRDASQRNGPRQATKALIGAVWGFVRDSSPARKRLRFGDADYDWDYRVNTTSGAVGWRERLLGEFFSAYQPTEPAIFREMLEDLQQRTCLDFKRFTFIDLGSGKGRTLLMASDHSFRRIIGIELLPALNAIAQQNLRQYKSESQKCFDLESVCADATRFELPEDPLVIFLFNPFAEAPLAEAVSNISKSLASKDRPVFVLYHNPEHENVLLSCESMEKICGTNQYSIFRNSLKTNRPS